MNEWYWYLFELIANINNIAFTLYLAYALFAKREHHFSRVSMYAIGAFGVAWLSLYSFTDFAFLSDIFPDIFVFLLFAIVVLRANWFMSILWTFINTLSIGVLTLVSMQIYSVLTGNSIASISSTGTSRFLLIILVQILRAATVVALSKSFGKRSKLTLIRRNWLGIALVPIFSVFLLFVLQKYSLLDVSNEMGGVYLPIIYIGILFINIAVLFFLFQLSSQAEKELEYQTHNKVYAMQRRHNEEMQKIYTDMRTARHDFSGRIQTIQGLIQMKRYDELAEYISTFSGFFISVTEFVDTGNKVIDALLSVKIGMAKAEQIVVEVDAQIPSDCIVTDDHLCSIVGNIFDNAYDACLLVEDKEKRFIQFKLYSENRNLCISCINSTSGKEQRSGKSWRTLKRDTDQHGLGLISIDRIVDEYNGFCSREHTNNQFVSTVIIPLETVPFV